LEDAFRNDAPRAWTDYLQFIERLQGEYARSMISRTENHESDRRLEVTFKQRPDCWLFVDQITDRGGEGVLAGSVVAVNPNYAFQLSRDGPGGDWSIADFRNRAPTIAWPPEGLSREMSGVNAVLHAPVWYSAIHGRFELLPAMEGYTLKAVRQVDDQGDSLVEVSFTYTPAQGAAPLRAEGIVRYDPARMWTIRAFDVQLTNPSGEVTKTDGTIEYDYSAAFPVMRSIKQHWQVASIAYDGDIQLDFRLSEGVSPETDFQLSAYGLPEPGESVHAASSPGWFLYLVVIGISLLAIAVLFRLVQGRRT
jgi:hypothetical protein